MKNQGLIRDFAEQDRPKTRQCIKLLGMSTITFDTLRYAKQLEASGIPAAQAEAFVNAQREILSEALDATLATKSDIRDVRVDIARLEAATKADIAKIDKELAVLKWMVGMVIAGVAAQIVKTFFG